MLKLFEFSQNNSWGKFVFDSKNGITHRVVIEASTFKKALKKAEEIGLYFDGCEKGIDCKCCGDRWSVYASEIDDLNTWLELVKPYSWLQPDVYVHRSDGSIEAYL